MTPPDIAQSAPLCILLSALGGAIEVLATAILAYQDANERTTGKTWSASATYSALTANVFLQVTSSMIGNLVATWFGPVSLVGPIYLCSSLLANMIIFGSLLGLESFNKDMRVGTYVVVIAVVLLPIVGPAAQDGQDVSSLLTSWYSLVWSGLQVAGMFLSAVFLMALDITELSEHKRIGLLLVARASAFTVNLTVSKLFVLDVGVTVLVVAIVLKLTSGVIITYALIKQSTSVPQAKFAPLNASALILVNAATGLIIWEDWRVVGSWMGYGCVFVQLVLGNYLLLGDVDLLSPDNVQYGRARAVGMASVHVRGALKRQPRSRHLVVEPIVQGGSVGGGGESSVGEAPAIWDESYEEGGGDSPYAYMRGGEGKGEDEGTALPSRRDARMRRGASTRREAWSSVYGLNDEFHSGGTNRRQTIFTIDADELSELRQLD